WRCRLSRASATVRRWSRSSSRGTPCCPSRTQCAKPSGTVCSARPVTNTRELSAPRAPAERGRAGWLSACRGASSSAAAPAGQRRQVRGRPAVNQRQLLRVLGPEGQGAGASLLVDDGQAVLVGPRAGSALPHLRGGVERIDARLARHGPRLVLPGTMLEPEAV